jgi:two-component system, sensor histidine kinase and response regulator
MVNALCGDARLPPSAFRLPVPVQYDWPIVLISLLAAIFASAIALFVVSRKKMGLFRAIVGSVFMGSAIAGMHYIGMAAMRLPAMCHYSPRIAWTGLNWQKITP